MNKYARLPFTHSLTHLPLARNLEVDVVVEPLELVHVWEQADPPVGIFSLRNDVEIISLA